MSDQPLVESPARLSPANRGAARCRGAWSVVAALLVAVLAVGLWAVSRELPAGGRTGRPLIAAPGLAASRPVESASTVRVAGFNIHRAKGDGGLGAIAEVLASADLAALSEVGYATGQHDDLAGRLGLSLLAAPTEQQWGRDSFGNAILTRLPVESWSVFPLERSSGRPARNVTLAIVRVGDVPLRVLATHLDRGGDTAAHLEATLSLFENLEPPALLLGDLNATGEDARLARTLVRQDVDDVLGRLAGEAPEKHIDWLLLRGGDVLKATAAGVTPSTASDHPLVWVELRAK